MKNDIKNNFNFPTPNSYINLDVVGDVFIRVGTLVYKIDVQKLIKDYGNIVQIINDNKAEE